LIPDKKRLTRNNTDLVLVGIIRKNYLPVNQDYAACCRRSAVHSRIAVTFAKVFPSKHAPLMKRKEMVAAVKHRFGSISPLPERIILYCSIKDIHHFRVEIKKLRALLKLLRTEQNNTPGLATGRHLKVAYQEAGIIRNLQLLHERLRVNSGSASLPLNNLSGLEKALEAHRVKLTTLFRDGSYLKKRREKILGSLPGHLGKPELNSFLHAKKAAIEKLLHSAIDDDSLHGLRKLLKELLYTRHLLKGLAAVGQDIYQWEKIKLLAGLLGKHQDAGVGISLLQESFIYRQTTATERAGLLALKNEWQREKDALLEKILNAVSATELLPGAKKPRRVNPILL
jgi:CHAD domain-containing protein